MSTPFSIYKPIRRVMKVQEQCACIAEIKEEVDKRLSDHDFDKIKELILWLAQNEQYQKIRKKDAELKILNFACDIWIEEKKKLEPLGIKEDFFCNVDSIEVLSDKYYACLFALLRMKMDMPEEYYFQTVTWLQENCISGIALINITEFERLPNECIFKLANWYREYENLVPALLMLQKMDEKYPKNKDVLLELAMIWLESGQMQKAYDCLRQIEKPEKDIKELIDELGQGVLHETV